MERYGYLPVPAAAGLQQGAKLVAFNGSEPSQFGQSVALSADGNTALIDGPIDNGQLGAAWIFTRSAGYAPQVGSAVALSADGNTALIGGDRDGNSGTGAAWVFTRSGSTWIQQGSKLVGSGASSAANEGYAVALSSDGYTALIGGPADSYPAGAAWVFTRSGTTWTQQGNKLVGAGAVGGASQGISVALSGDGATASVGG
jgi:hypothetical protein